MTIAVTALLVFGVSESATVERGYRRDQGRRRSDRDRRRGALHRSGELAPVHPREHRDVRRVRLERHPARRRRHLLRLHRLRRGLDVRSGGAATRSATCRGGSSGRSSICTVLYVLVSGVMVGLVPYKAMLNQPAPLVRGRTGCRRSRRRHAVAVADGRRASTRDRRRAGGPELCHARDDAGPAAHLPGDGARRSAAGVGGAHSSRATTRRTSPRSSPASSWRSPRA